MNSSRPTSNEGKMKKRTRLDLLPEIKLIDLSQSAVKIEKKSKNRFKVFLRSLNFLFESGDDVHVFIASISVLLVDVKAV